MKLAWATDIHFDHARIAAANIFMAAVKESDCDALVITGDISVAHLLEGHLGLLTTIGKPVYFVLGNHDYCGSSIQYVQETTRKVAKKYKNLTWLTESKIVNLTEKSCLIGHDSWADGRFGNTTKWWVDMLEYRYTSDFMGLDHYGILRVLNRLGDEAALQLSIKAENATKKYDTIYVATHTPPFIEATWHMGLHSDNAHLPHFACKAVGEALVKVMKKHTDKKMIILCGHTHGGGHAEILPNLIVETGPAEYKSPVMGPIFDID